VTAAVLANGELPSSLALLQNHSVTAVGLGRTFGHTYRGCPGHFAVFTEKGRTPTPVSAGAEIFTELFSESSLCPSATAARSAFARAAASVEAKAVAGTPVSGLGDTAVVATVKTDRAVEYALFWKAGRVLGFIQLSGPKGAMGITVAQVKALARRQMARSSPPESVLEAPGSLERTPAPRENRPPSATASGLIR
jgi:hypothetical protein